MWNDNTYRYDKLVGEDGIHICAGECAFWRCGLSGLYIDNLMCWTLKVGINGIWNPIAMWYFNPWAKDTFDTTPSPVCSNILQPVRERAICEYVMFKEYFDEGILIEGIQTYLRETEQAVDTLHKFMGHLPYQRHDLLDYWIQEAINDPQEG